MAQQVYFFNASLNTVRGTPDDPAGVWSQKTFPFDGSLINNFAALSDSTLGSTSVKYLYAKGTSAPSTGPPIQSVNIRIWEARSGLGTQSTVTIYTASLAQTLLSSLTPNNAPGFPFFYLTPTTPTGGWTWPVIQTLELKAYDGIGDGSISSGLSKVDVIVTIARNISAGNSGISFSVGNGMSRSEVAY